MDVKKWIDEHHTIRKAAKYFVAGGAAVVIEYLLTDMEWISAVPAEYQVMLIPVVTSLLLAAQNWAKNNVFVPKKK